jgi:RNA polymerase sigma factor (TIGR02999 family)
MADQEPRDRLVPLVYDELRRLAHHYMRGERAGHTLQTTALVNEAYLRLAGIDRIEWHDRGHFLAVASTMMRRILVDYARERSREKRGSGVSVTTLDDGVAAPGRAVMSSRSTRRSTGSPRSIRGRGASWSCGSSPE